MTTHLTPQKTFLCFTMLTEEGEVLDPAYLEQFKGDRPFGCRHYLFRISISKLESFLEHGETTKKVRIFSGCYFLSVCTAVKTQGKTLALSGIDANTYLSPLDYQAMLEISQITEPNPMNFADRLLKIGKSYKPRRTCSLLERLLNLDTDPTHPKKTSDVLKFNLKHTYTKTISDSAEHSKPDEQIAVVIKKMEDLKSYIRTFSASATGAHSCLVNVYYPPHDFDYRFSLTGESPSVLQDTLNVLSTPLRVFVKHQQLLLKKRDEAATAKADE